MSETCKLPILVCSLAVAVMLLQACSGIAQEIREDHNRKFTQRNTVHVVSVPQPPTEGDLAARLGTPTVYQVEDLSLHAYELDYEELKLLHAETRSAAGEEDNPSVWCEGVGCVFFPLFLPILIFDAPFVGIELALEEGERAKQVEALTGRLAVFAYDLEGNYRWHGCCLSTGVIDEFGLHPGLLPYTVKPEAGQPGRPTTYRADKWVMYCHRAKAGNGFSRRNLFSSFNKFVPDPVQTYYWARMASQTPGAERPIYFRWEDDFRRVEASLPPEALKAGEAYFLSHPLETVDCREVANLLVEAENAGSEGPNVRP